MAELDVHQGIVMTFGVKSNVWLFCRVVHKQEEVFGSNMTYRVRVLHDLQYPDWFVRSTIHNNHFKSIEKVI